MDPLRILHVIGQRPEMTGSGVYLAAMIRQSQQRGLASGLVAGVPAGGIAPAMDPLPSYSAFVRFGSAPLDFPIVGMSDVMPYPSSRFKDLRGRRLTAYKAEFSRVLQAAVAQFKPDVVHTNHLFLLSALVRKRFPNLAVVATCHGTDLRQFHNCPHLRRYVRRHCRQLDRIIALTADQKREISGLYDIPFDQIAVVGGGYDEALFTRAPKSPAGTVQILYAGKLNRSKGVPWLLTSLEKIRDLDWHLHLAGSGSGPEFDDCLALAQKLGPKVTCHGYVTHCRLAELMKQAHVQVLPSFFEGLPLALFEGLASGCRIVATNLSGFPEIFGPARSDTIDLIPLPALETIDRPFPEDAARLEKVLCERILKMIDRVRAAPEVDDPGADRIAARYTWARVFERTLAVYTAVAERRSS
jgi:glycosyltransferase involved in cell wall biosynthesis